MAVRTFGRYEIKSEIRRGGMASVYRAYDPRFEREVALKVLPPQLLHDPDFRERFDREAKTIAALEHPAIVPVHDYGEEEEQPFLVMRLMQGGSLADRIALGPLSVKEALDVLRRVAQALDDAHARDVVHRDLKPGNILFDQKGNAYLSDFGIAKLLQASTTLTGSNVIVGTPAYISPEQGRGDKDIDGRSDIYSLGAILFEMLSGRVPYEADTPTGQIIKHITEPVPDILMVRQDLPPGVQTVIAHSMAKARGNRYASASEMVKALETVARGETLPAVAPETLPYIPPVPKEDAPERPPQRKGWGRLPVWAWIGGGITVVVLLALLGLVAGGVIPARSTDTPTPTLTQLPQPSSTPTPTVTVLPSSTPRPTGTLTPTSSPTPTGTPTPQLFAVVSVPAANVRSGPGTMYPRLDVFPQGTELAIVGRNEASTWLAVLLPDSQEMGWISLTTVRIDFDVEILTVVETPPTPTYRPMQPTTEGEPEGQPAPARTPTQPPKPPTKTPTEEPYPYP